MDKRHSTFVLQTLFVFFTPCLLKITSADVRSVHPGENITLPCNITNYPEISWYRLRSDEVKLLLSAEEWKLKKTYYLSYKVNESHINVAQSSSSVNLVIIGVRETDLGFYYCCGGQTDTTHTQLGKPIRLNFTDDDDAPTTHFAVIISIIIIIILSCVCALLVSISITCSSLYCSTLQDKNSSTRESNNKEAEVQPSDVTCVTYCTNSSPRNHLSVQGSQSANNHL